MIGASSIGGSDKPAPQRRLVPMKVGAAVVYVEQSGDPIEIEADDSIYAVAPVQEEAFEQAGQVIDECVRVVGARIVALAHDVCPQKVTVEFSLTFEATGKAHIIPLLVTGETKVNTGLKVTAVWDHPGGQEG